MHLHTSRCKMQRNENLQFSQRAIKIEDSISLLQLLAFFLGRRQDHCSVRAIHFKEY